MLPVELGWVVCHKHVLMRLPKPNPDAMNASRPDVDLLLVEEDVMNPPNSEVFLEVLYEGVVQLFM